MIKVTSFDVQKYTFQHRPIISLLLLHLSPSRVDAVASCSTKAKPNKPPKDSVKTPYYVKGFPRKPINRIKADEMKNLGEIDDSSGPRLYDYYKIQEIINRLPSIKEKIDFVTPYERAWNTPEKTWHRRYMPSMLQPRKAWSVPPTPRSQDTLNFYKYITKTRLADPEESARFFDEYYQGYTMPMMKFERRLVESLLCYFERRSESERSGLANEEFDKYAGNRNSEILDQYFRNSKEMKKISQKEDPVITDLLRSIIDDALLVLAPGHTTRLLQLRVSHTPRCESFWVRSGFRDLYLDKPIWESPETPVTVRKTRFTGDDRRRLGELAFTMRDSLAVNLRSNTPTKSIFNWSNSKLLEASIFPNDIDVVKEVVYSPMVYSLYPDGSILFQCPGYDTDVDETHKYGRLAVKNVASLIDWIDTRLCPSTKHEHQETIVEALQSTSITTLFNWLNGQAHCLGHTQYTDLNEKTGPLTSQLILSDGRLFFFAIGQLNTIAINIDVKGFHNPLTNLCCVDGPHALYDRFDSSTGTFLYIDKESGQQCSGLNPAVMHRILQMCCI